MSTSPPAPTKIGRYEILGELGKGAMGVVYLARDPIIGRELALKTFKNQLSANDPDFIQFRERFLREAQSAGILSHPNIVTIHDVVDHASDGSTFIAMEFIRGTDLRTRMKEGGGRLEADQAADILAQVADGLDFAHSKKVIHRDIKPANILLTTEGRAKITDFGIARMDTSNLTQEGQLLGTPNYMAPEQITGGTVDHRADLFSLGVVLYEMLTGRKPFQGDNLTMVAHRIVYDSFTDPREFVLDLPERYNTVLARALAKKPDDRYPTARALAKDFREAVDGGGAALSSIEATLALGTPTIQLPPEPPTLTAPMPPPERPRTAAPARAAATQREARSVSAGRLAVVAAIAVALGGAIAGGAGLWVSGQHPPASAADEASLTRAQILPLWREARQQVALGRPSLAIALYTQAIRLAPREAGLAVQRDQIERQLRARRTPEPLSPTGLEGLVLSAQNALASNRLDAALDAARRALILDAGSRGAQAVIDEVGRRRALPLPPKTSASLPPSSAPPPATASTGAPSGPAAPAGATVPATATLDIDFYSETPEGSLSIYVGREQIVKEDFAFWEKKGFFGGKRAKPGRIQSSHTLPRGPTELSVYVQVEGRPTRKSTLETDLAGGARALLKIRLDKEGGVGVALD